MERIEAIEKAIQEKADDLTQRGINPTLFWAYRTSQHVGNAHINFSEVIWDKDVLPIAEALKENGVEEFTISSTFSSLITTLALFEAQGFAIIGLTTVKTLWESKMPAIRMKRKELV